MYEIVPEANRRKIEECCTNLGAHGPLRSRQRNRYYLREMERQVSQRGRREIRKSSNAEVNDREDFE